MNEFLLALLDAAKKKNCILDCIVEKTKLLEEVGTTSTYL